MINRMDKLPLCLEQIILGYKEQLEVTEKFGKCLKEIENLSTTRNTVYHKTTDTFILYFTTTEKNFRYTVVAGHIDGKYGIHDIDRREVDDDGNHIEPVLSTHPPIMSDDEDE